VASSGPAPTPPCLPCAGGSRAGGRAPGGVSAEQSRGQNHLSQPAGHTALDAAQDMVGLLGCKRTLLDHINLFIHHYPQVLLLRAALNSFVKDLIKLSATFIQPKKKMLCFFLGEGLH